MGQSLKEKVQRYIEKVHRATRINDGYEGLDISNLSDKFIEIGTHMIYSAYKSVEKVATRLDRSVSYRSICCPFS